MLDQSTVRSVQTFIFRLELGGEKAPAKCSASDLDTVRKDRVDFQHAAGGNSATKRGIVAAICSLSGMSNGSYRLVFLSVLSVLHIVVCFRRDVDTKLPSAVA